MIVYRSGQTFSIDARNATYEMMRKQYAEVGSAAAVGHGAGVASLDYRRWWAERQPEVRWAQSKAGGAYVVDVSQVYWRERSFLLIFELASDASRFALLFLGLDQVGCEKLAPEI